MKLVFAHSQHEVGEVWSFFFQAENMPEWQAGQYLNLSMPDVAPVFADRIFTITSAPHDNLLQFTTLLTPSPFKQRLASLQTGDVVEADQLGGDFIYEIPAYVRSSYASEIAENPKRLFIAGGIGVTPYVSIIRDRLHKGQPVNATLLYAGTSDRRPFLKELERAAKEDSTFIIKHYDKERLTLEKLRTDIPDIHSWIVYLAGSQKFSESLGEGLVATDHPRNQIKYDYFDGYVNVEY